MISHAWRIVAIAGVLGALGAGGTWAQSYGPAGYGATESLEVIAPRFHEEGSPLKEVPDKVSLSMPVRYGDLDLRTWRGATVLRGRVREAAWTTCERLARGYPFYTEPGTSCYRSAVESGLLRADEVIDNARVSWGAYGY